MSTLITARPSDPNDPSENYPPKNEENAALVLLLDEDHGVVLAHKGCFLWAQIECAGFTFEEVCFRGAPDEPGYYALRNGVPDVGEDWAHIDGDWRAATLADFEFFGVDLPPIAEEAKRPTKARDD